ncbi:halocarboxylic acid dehydrogenase DehI family protein [Roseimaritima sediminicola]|uniref:halocarboxylic acid dehydrogenase DehI family protein n=1 Tax=Roseimaritima sediminicola TaxID=2662066 RepID=UPI001386930C|nr:halocarboxylic acid dehydrogenase DehI family protein [Roseimaritima sediminicola]
MLGLSKRTIDEYEASGEIERVYAEIQPTLRVSGVNLNFRTWAAQDHLLPLLWDPLKANCGTDTFEQSADELRATAAASAIRLSRLEAHPAAGLGESQAFQLHEALKLYHFVNPKLLLFTSTVKLALDGELHAPDSFADVSKTPRRVTPGAPPDMYPMAMVDEQPDDTTVQEVFDDIKQTLDLKSVNSDYRTMALWPAYLKAMWRSLKPVTQQQDYTDAADRLRDRSRQLAGQLPLPISLPTRTLEAGGADVDKAIETTAAFECLLPGLILNIALCLRDFVDDDRLSESPWPASYRTLPE